MALTTHLSEPNPGANSKPAPAPVRLSARFRPCAFVAGSLLIGCLLWSGSAYLIGKTWEDSRCYLKNYRAPNSYEAHVAPTMQYVLHSDERNDVVFLGDSACLESLITRQFEHITGLKAYNLGTLSTIGIEGHLVVLRRYLEHHSRPRVVVFCISPINLQNRPVNWGPDEVRENFMWCFGRRVEDAHPVHQNRITDYSRLGSWVTRGFFSGGFDHFAQDYSELAAKRTLERGYWASPEGGRPAAAVPYLLLEDASAIQPDRLDSLTRLFRLTAENDILLLIRLGPAFPIAGPADTAFVEAWPKELEDRFAKVIVSRPLVLHYDLAYFADTAHCNRKGAELFTALTAHEVRKMLKMD